MTTHSNRKQADLTARLMRLFASRLPPCDTFSIRQARLAFNGLASLLERARPALPQDQLDALVALLTNGYVGRQPQPTHRSNIPRAVND